MKEQSIRHRCEQQLSEVENALRTAREGCSIAMRLAAKLQGQASGMAHLRNALKHIDAAEADIARAHI